MGTGITLPLSIRNDGPGTLLLSNLTLSPTSSPFSISPASFPDPLLPLAAPVDLEPSFTIQVTYNPQTVTGVTDVATLGAIADRHGVDMARIEAPAIKLELKDRTAETELAAQQRQRDELEHDLAF